MIEGRYKVKNIKDIKELIIELKGIYKGNYTFTDIILVRKKEKINLEKEFIRLRINKISKWKTKPVILTHKRTEWINNHKKDTLLLKKEFNNKLIAMKFIKKHFKNQVKIGFSYSRTGNEYYIRKNKLYLENIRKLYPSIEILAENKKELNKLTKNLKVGKQLKYSIPETIRRSI